MFVGTLDEDILMIKVRTERDKSLKKWSLEFDLTKIKMFTFIALFVYLSFALSSLFLPQKCMNVF